MLPKTARWKVRRFRPSDAEALVRAINHRKIARVTAAIPHPYTNRHAKAWIRLCMQRSQQRRPTDLGFAIEIDGAVRGGIGLHHIRGHQAEVGYWLTPEYWGQGIMTGVVKAMTIWARRELGLVRLYAKVFPHNPASARVLEKAGYVREGVLKKEHKKDGRYLDALLYASVR